MSAIATKRKRPAVEKPVRLSPEERELMYEALKSLDREERAKERAKRTRPLFNETFEQVCPHCGKPVTEKRTRL
jgi:hypothetical protein